MMDVAVLFARADSIYKTLPGCDVYDIDRDARTFPGGMPVVAHPPCRMWGKLRQFAKGRPDEKDLARFAVAMVRQWGAYWSTRIHRPFGLTKGFRPPESATPVAAGRWSSTKTGLATRQRSGRSSTSWESTRGISLHCRSVSKSPPTFLHRTSAPGQDATLPGCTRATQVGGPRSAKPNANKPHPLSLNGW